MNDIILKIESMSKQYRLGLVGTGTLAHDLNRWWYSIRGKEDPYLKIGASNDRSTAQDSQYVWALKDINLEVRRGEVLGIIGKNGAGKSTLLKILSRVTLPTTGTIKSRGRIASLLEVGTGFHPELTGRENIYLNGAILGMTKTEIEAKEEEIIEFSGCRLYIDTPVKRYSSGMRVRLGFAVAAFLEPDILVVDEVLAVGDAEFQKKAIGKMQDISTGSGRTVLFVSHNMASVSQLCDRAVVLDQGSIVYEGAVDQAIANYILNSRSKVKALESRLPVTNEAFGLSLTGITGHLDEAGHIRVEMEITTQAALKNIGFGFRIKDEQEMVLGTYSPALSGSSIDLPAGRASLVLTATDFVSKYAGGVVTLDVWISKPKVEKIIELQSALQMDLPESDLYQSGMNYSRQRHGLIKFNGTIELK